MTSKLKQSGTDEASSSRRVFGLLEKISRYNSAIPLPSGSCSVAPSLANREARSGKLTGSSICSMPIEELGQLGLGCLSCNQQVVEQNQWGLNGYRKPSNFRLGDWL